MIGEDRVGNERKGEAGDGGGRGTYGYVRDSGHVVLQSSLGSSGLGRMFGEVVAVVLLA